MEQVGPRAALEPQEVMRLGRSIRILAAGGAVLAPLCVFGHAIEFLTARLTLLPEAIVRLEVTADHAFNPLIPDQTAAMEALRSPMEVQVGGGWRSLNDMGAPAVENHVDWKRCAPPNLPPPPPEAVHALVTASWQWRHPEPELVLRVPKGRVHDVFLWQPLSGQEDGGTQWMLLLAGDVTKRIPVTTAGEIGPWWIGVTLAAGVVLLWWAWMARRRR
jgi:hypothetical protein